MENKKSSRMTARDLTYIAFFTTLIVICAWMKLPFIIPFTMQSFGIFLSVGLLGGKRSTACILLYILLGAIGFPVFSGFAGGFGVLFGNTGGYIIGFLAPALLKWASEHLPRRPKHTLALCMIIGLLVCYGFGTAWYMHLYTQSLSIEALLSVLGISVAPFVVPDFIKLALALVLTKRLKKYVK